jgi:hypothetical protein
MPETENAPRAETARRREAVDDPSFIRILRELRDDGLSLVRQEVALARREIMDQIAMLGRNAAFLAAGALAGVFGLFFVLLALSNLLFTGLAKAGFSGAIADWLAPAMVGMSILIVALSFALKSLRGLRKSSPMPRQALETLREDKVWLQEKFR